VTAPNTQIAVIENQIIAIKNGVAKKATAIKWGAGIAVCVVVAPIAITGVVGAAALAAIPKLKDQRGSHKKWRAVSVTNKGKWQWYDLQVSVAPTPVQATASKRK
jgi:hypothetical protein